MRKLSFQVPRLCMAGLLVGALWMAVQVAAQTDQAVRAELAAPLRSAQDLLAQQKWAEALVQLEQADKVGASRPAETYLLERLRAAAASGAGDARRAARSLELALATGQAQASEQPALMEAVAAAYMRLQDWPAAADAAQRALALAPKSPRLRLMRAQSQYFAQDFAGAAASLEELVREGAQPPAQAQLEMLGSSYQKLKDTRGYMRVLEQLLTHHPKPEYWADLLAHVEGQPGFPRDLLIDLLRLQLAAGAMSEAGEYIDLAQQALKAGFAAEALKVLEAGVQARQVGAGPREAEHGRLLAQVRKLAQEDLAANGAQPAPAEPGRLFNAGYNRVLQGDAREGLAQMTRALEMPALQRPAQARLRLGQALLLAGDKASALQAFRAVRKQGADAGAEIGAAQLARLWLLHIEPS